MKLSEQIIDAAARLAASEAGVGDTRESFMAAFISGASLTAHYLTANDGACTAQEMERAIEEAAAQLGLQKGKI